MSQQRLRALPPNCKATHCMIHREMLATLKINVELNNVLSETVEAMDFLKANALNLCLFTLLCEDMESEHQRLLFCREV